MNLELWGIKGIFYIGLPHRLSGYLLLGLDVIILFVLLFIDLRKYKLDKSFRSDRKNRHFALLLFLAPIAAVTLLVQLVPPANIATPGIPIQPTGLVFSILGAIPWMMAAGLLGGWQAIVVALIGGLAWGGWQTHSLLTPMNMALQAGFVSWLLRQDYDEWPGRIMRHPLVAGVAGGLLFGLLNVVGLFAYTGGEFYDALSFSLSNAPFALIAALFESGFAGLLCETLRESAPKVWYQPRQRISAPYNRSLAGQMITGFVIMWAIASGIMLYGDWLMAHRYAQELVATQMKQTALQTGDGIPYFIQAGRSLMRQYAVDLSEVPVDTEALELTLGRQLRMVPYFNQLALFDPNGDLVTILGDDEVTGGTLPLELKAGISAAQAGIPQESAVASQPGSMSARLVFFTPINAAEDSPSSAVLAGWTELAVNPLLMPVVRQIEQLGDSEAFITNDRGVILVHADASRVMDKYDFNEAQLDEVYSDTAPDGSRQWIYIHALAGYPWRVVVTTPQSVVDQLAIRMAVRLSGVIALVGIALVGLVYATSRHLINPLRQMAQVAESIAQGKLTQPVQASGEDEIGRLAIAFEGMRHSLKARLDEMDLLLNVSRRMASSFELAQVLPPILADVQKVTVATQVRLVLSSEAMDVSGGSESFQSGEDINGWGQLDSQVLNLCQQRGRFMLENPSRARAVLDLEKLKKPIEALIAVPMQNEDEFVGTLWLGYHQPHAFSPGEINLLTIIAGQLGVSVANTRLYHRAEKERSRLMAILESTPDAVIVISGDGRISLANPAAEAVLQGKADEVHDRLAEEVITAPELIDLFLAHGSDTHTTEVTLPDGRVLFAVVSEARLGIAGQADRVCVLSDITHFKKLDMLKSEFVSTVSHDLRAPLTLMKGYTTMLPLVGSMNDQQEEFMRKIMESAEQMSRLVGNLLDLGRIEAGVGLKLERVQVGNIIQDVIHSYRPQAINKQISFEIELSDRLDEIEIDPALLRQALANLVDNAIKYTQPKGRVTLQAGQNAGWQRISIKDSGVGIAPKDQVRLFERFHRPDRHGRLHEKGYGLGLAIAKSIVEQHDGRISVESRLGVGSTFTIELPIDRKRAENSQAATPLDRGVA